MGKELVGDNFITIEHCNGTLTGSEPYLVCVSQMPKGEAHFSFKFLLGFPKEKK